MENYKSPLEEVRDKYARIILTNGKEDNTIVRKEFAIEWCKYHPNHSFREVREGEITSLLTNE